MRCFILSLLLIVCSIEAFGQNSIEMVSYEQNWDDDYATISLKNCSSSVIDHVRFVIEYYNMNGEMEDYKEFCKEVIIEPGKAKRVNIEAYEQSRNYAYETSKALHNERRYKIKFYSKNNIDRTIEEPTTGSEETELIPEEELDPPSFPGGNEGLKKFLSREVKYPVLAKKNGIQGRVIVSFVVDVDGEISDINIERSVDPSLDREAARVVKSMPKWIPGKVDGKPVKVRYAVPIAFRLN